MRGGGSTGKCGVVNRYTSHLRDDVFDYGGTLNRIPFFLTIGEQDNIAKMNNINFLRCTCMCVPVCACLCMCLCRR